jgi:hypothetical protein
MIQKGRGMEKDFHYYITYSIAKLTGYDKADIIAYSSQFVDDNNEGQFVIDGGESFFPEKIPTTDGYYYPMMTQSLSPISLNLYIQKYIYIPFHFLPGDNNVEINGKKNPFSTTPNSQNARTLLKEALKSKNPYRIGIALHPFSDTWSHQNFTGFCEEWNSVYPWYNVFKSIVPNIGHAEVGHSPDVISEDWIDYRINKKIINKVRAFEAVAETYKIMRRDSRKGPVWTDMKARYKEIIDTFGYDERIAKVDSLVMDNQLGSIPKYSKDDWIGAALDKKEGKITMSADFFNMDWYHFHQAAKVHFATVMNLIKEL